MKNYTVVSDSKNPCVNSNTLESFVINAKNYKHAEKSARRLCRLDGRKFVSVKLKSAPLPTP